LSALFNFAYLFCTKVQQMGVKIVEKAFWHALCKEKAETTNTNKETIMSTLVRYANPVNAFFNDFFNATSEGEKPTYYPAIDVIENDKAYKLYADLPGLDKDEITISVEAGVLSISGEKTREEVENSKYRMYERSVGTFTRRFQLPEDADAEKVSAEMKNGELVITIPKAEKALPKKIAISVK